MSHVFDALRKVQETPLDTGLVIRTMPQLADAPIGLETAESVQACLSPESRLIVHGEPHTLGADRFRLLRVRFRELRAKRNLQTVLITSALPREGKSTTALNLSVALAEYGRCKVVLVEADFRQPSLPGRLGLEPWPALVRCLEEDRDPLAAIRRVDPLGIYLLPAGEEAANPLDLLNSESFAHTINTLRACADWVIIDAPPVGPVPDVLAIKGRADGCLWVLQAGSTPRELVDESIQQVGRTSILGMVLNGVDGMESGYSSYYGYSPAKRRSSE